MTVYAISLSPEVQQSGHSPVGAIEAAGGVPVWENVWFIECDEHPFHKFQLLTSGGAFAAPISTDDFLIAVGQKCSVEMRKFVTDKIMWQGMNAAGSDRTGHTYTYINGGEQRFGAIVETFERRQRESPTTPLCEIMARHGSDKGLAWHNYTQFYSVLFEPIRDQVRSVFEVGLGTNFVDVPSSMGPDGVPGASLRGWRAYFPQAMIYGGDIDQRVLFSDDRIQTYFIDQLRPETLTGLWSHMPHILFDIFIDDGLHEFDAAAITFRSCFSRVRQSGFYVIEDVVIDLLPQYVEFLQDGGIDAVVVNLYHSFNKGDNCVIVAAPPSSQG